MITWESEFTLAKPADLYHLDQIVAPTVAGYLGNHLVRVTKPNLSCRLSTIRYLYKASAIDNRLPAAILPPLPPALSSPQSLTERRTRREGWTKTSIPRPQLRSLVLPRRCYAYMSPRSRHDMKLPAEDAFYDSPPNGLAPPSPRGGGRAEILPHALALPQHDSNWDERPTWSKATRTRLQQCFTTKTLLGWPPEDSARETAWLDGLRGVAAFLVLTYHLHLTIFMGPWLEAPLGATVQPPKGIDFGLTSKIVWDVWRLPILRLWMCSGHVQVSIFFVLSGLVLSWSPLESSRRGSVEKLAVSLSSAVFRRWIRLYLPCFAVAFWQFWALWLGLPNAANRTRSESFWAQLGDFLIATEKFANPFYINRTEGDAVHDYDWTMWTIPFEFAGSLLVFGLCLAVGRSKRFWTRTMVIGTVTAYACLKAEWAFWLFGMGVLLANYVRHRGGFEALSNHNTWRSTATWSATMVFSLLLAGLPAPSELYDRPGYEWITAVTPSNWMEIEGGARFWFCWSGILFVVSASHLGAVRHVFQLPVARYLGRVSYMLYLTHRIVFGFICVPLTKALVAAFGRKLTIDSGVEANAFQRVALTVLLYMVIFFTVVPVVILVAHACEVLIDRPSTKLARRLDEWSISDAPWYPFRREGAIVLPLHTKESDEPEETMPLTADIEMVEAEHFPKI